MYEQLPTNGRYPPLFSNLSKLAGGACVGVSTLEHIPGMCECQHMLPGHGDQWLAISIQEGAFAMGAEHAAAGHSEQSR